MGLCGRRVGKGGSLREEDLGTRGHVLLLLPLAPSHLSSVSPLPLLRLRPRFRTLPPGRPGDKSLVYSPVAGLWKTGLCPSLFCAMTLGWVICHE